MNLTDALAFLRDNHHTVLATNRRDGRLQLSPVLATVDDTGRVVISSREPAAKVRNLRRDPRANLCVFTNQFFGRWTQLEGSADIISMPDALEPLVDYYRAVSGEHDDWAKYRAAMRAERRCLIRIEVAHAGPSST